MPNWILNKCTFSGTKSNIDNLINAFGGKEKFEFSFDKVIPIPKELLEIKSPVNMDIAWYAYLKGMPVKYFNIFSAEAALQNQSPVYIVRLKKIYIDCMNNKDGDFREAIDFLIKSVPEDNKKNPLNADLVNAKKAIECSMKYGYTDWYTWRNDNYGCKWDCNNASGMFNYVENENYASFDVSFTTPNSSPYAALSRIAYEFKVNIQNSYAEEFIGCNCGVDTYNYFANRLSPYEDSSKEAVLFAKDLWGAEEDLVMIDDKGHWELDYD